MIYLYVTDVGQ